MRIDKDKHLYKDKREIIKYGGDCAADLHHYHLCLGHVGYDYVILEFSCYFAWGKYPIVFSS